MWLTSPCIKQNANWAIQFGLDKHIKTIKKSIFLYLLLLSVGAQWRCLVSLRQSFRVVLRFWDVRAISQEPSGTLSLTRAVAWTTGPSISSICCANGVPFSYWPHFWCKRSQLICDIGGTSSDIHHVLLYLFLLERVFRKPLVIQMFMLFWNHGNKLFINIVVFFFIFF